MKWTQKEIEKRITKFLIRKYYLPSFHTPTLARLFLRMMKEKDNEYK